MVAIKRFITIYNKNVAYLDWNHDSNNSINNTIICIHGINRNKHDFDYLANYLSKHGFRVIALDIPGRGESEYLEHYSEYNYENYHRFLIEFINKLKIEEFSLIGTSMGGIISMSLAGEMHNRIKSIVINDIGPFTDSVTLKILSKYVCSYPIFNNIKEASEYIKIFLRPLNIKSSEHWDHMIMHSIRKTSDNSYVLDYDPEILINFKNSIKRNRELWETWNKMDQNVPILILRGQKSSMLTKETLLKMLESRSNIDYIEYPEVGHTPSLLETQQLADIENWMVKTLNPCQTLAKSLS